MPLRNPRSGVPASTASRSPVSAAARLRGTPLGTRLMRACVASAVVALIVAGVILNVFAYFSARDALVEDAVVHARSAADNSIPPLVFGDERTARESLQPLTASHIVLRATVVDAAGKPFVEYRRPGEDDTTRVRRTPTALGQPSQRIEDQRLFVTVPLVHHRRQVGQLEFVASTAPLMRRAVVFAAITAVAALSALAMSYLLVLGIRRDVDLTEARLDELAHVDPVTGLPNRHAANEHLGALIEQAKARQERFSLLLLDVDDFKLINDSLGHATGDRVLKVVAQRLRGGVRAHDHVFRFGGDEFIVVFHSCGDARELARLGNLAVTALAAPVRVGERELSLRGSAGIASFPEHAGDVEALLQAADTAMYTAKARGKNACAVYLPSMGQQLQERLQVQSELRQAVANGELVLHFQPIVSLAREGNPVIGAEALVRWHHPRRGLLLPGAFIDVAEESDLIVDIGGWVLDEAAKHLADWHARGLLHLFVSVNVSARQIMRGALAGQVAQALARHRVQPRSLELEITESMLLQNIESHRHVLEGLRSQGIRLAVDDFGTGQSSLSYLKRLPVDKFKIDRSFVQELPHDQGDIAIVKAIISMAHTLRLQVVAEGVESIDQRDVLADMQCACAQGFLFSRPVAADRFLEVVAKHAPRERLATPSTY
jgi:diguanylate cyclase